MTPSSADRRRALVEVLADALLRLADSRDGSRNAPSDASAQPTREK